MVVGTKTGRGAGGAYSEGPQPAENFSQVFPFKVSTFNVITVYKKAKMVQPNSVPVILTVVVSLFKLSSQTIIFMNFHFEN